MADTTERESLFSDSQFYKTALQAISLQKQSATYCDVIMRICGKELYAHSNILAAASPYFSVFLAQDLPRQFSQRSPQIIEIQIEGSNPSHLYEEALESIMDYIYTGKLKVQGSNAFQIIEIARIMQMNKLVIFCEAFLQGKLPGASETVVSPPCVLHSVAVNTTENFQRSKLQNTKFKGNKFISVATLVNPQLLGLESAKSESRDERTQTCERDFVEARPSKTGRPRGRPRKYPRPEDATSEREETADVSQNESTEENEPAVKENDGEIMEEDEIEADAEILDEEPLEGPEIQDPEKTPSAASILESRKEDASEVSNATGETPVSPIGMRRSSRKFKPTIKLQEASRNMLIDESASDQQQAENDNDNDADVIVTSVIKRRRGRPPKFRQRVTHMATTKLIQAEHLISRLTTKSENVQHDPQNVVVDYDEMTSEQDDNQKENYDVPDIADVSPVRESQDYDDDDHAEDAEPVSDNTQSVSVSRSGRVRTLTSTISALKKNVSHKYQCGSSSCNFTTNRVREMSNHRKLHKLEQNICYYCENHYDRREDLIEHLEKHKGPMPFYCPVCDFRFKTRTQLSLHLPKHSDSKPFKCIICDARFKWKHAVKNHMVVHSNKKDHLCDVCGYATAHKSQLKAHRLIHTGNTFKCSFPGCDFQATKKQNLQYHLFSHTQEKPHQCEICGQNFSLVKNLRRHKLLHSSESRHNCDRCEFHTTRYDKLKEHLLRQHAVGTPPEKRIRVSDLVMQNFVGTPEEAESLGLNIKSEGAADSQNETPEGEVVSMETITDTANTDVHTVIDASGITEITGTEALSIAADESGQHIEFLEMPSETIIIQSIEAGDDEHIALPIVTQDGTTIQCAEVQGGDGKDPASMQSLGYTEIMIPVSQISDFVQHVTYVSQ